MTNGTSTLELTLCPATNRGVRSLVEVLVSVVLVAALLLARLVLAQGAGPPF
jgi:Tfp pilus assembly protein PilV